MNKRIVIGIVLALLFLAGLFGSPSNMLGYIIVAGLLFLLPATFLIWTGSRTPQNEILRKGNNLHKKHSIFKLFEAILMGNIYELILALAFIKKSFCLMI